MKLRQILSLFVLCILALLVGSCVTTKDMDVSNSHKYAVSSPGYLYDSIVIEVQPNVLNEPHLEQLLDLRAALDKYRIAPGSRVHFVVRQPVNFPKAAWLRAELDPYEQQHRAIQDSDPNDRNLVLWMGFFGGSFIDQQYLNTIGMQYSSSSIAIMGFTNNSTRRVAVMLHEILHAVKMVNLKNRKEKPVNPDRPNHCNDDKCVMFWVVANTPTLCEKCQADIRSRLGN